MRMTGLHSELRSLRSGGSTASLAPSMDRDHFQTVRLLAMVTRLEARLRHMAEERDRVRKLLDEADAALAAAGVPYRPGNIRERISAYRVFRKDYP